MTNNTLSAINADNNEYSVATSNPASVLQYPTATQLQAVGCPQLRRDELLSFATIISVLKKSDDDTIYSTIDSLKQQAKQQGISARDMNSMITRAKNEITKKIIPQLSADGQFLFPKQLINADDLSGFNFCGYNITEQGIYTTIGEHIVQVCPQPIYPIQIFKNIDTHDEKVRLAFFKRGKWQSDLVVDRLDISSSQRIVKLSPTGIMVNDENARYLIKYLCDIEMNNEQFISIINSTTHLGFTEHGFVPYTKKVIYDLSDGDNRRRFELYREHGDFDTWRDLQIQCTQHVIPRIVIAAGYASLLLEKFGLNPFGVHLWGDTGKGKSVSILASASIYGYPAINDGIVYTGNATANGLEPRLSFVRNCCFYLDELSLLSDKQIDDMVMLIMQGQGKMRMQRTGSARESYYWNCVSVTNSEMPITNDFSKGGVFNRIIQISSPNGQAENSPKSIFGDMDLPEIADTFEQNYGFGAKRFIQALEIPDCFELISKIRKSFYNKIIPHTEDKQANAASLLLVAYTMANKFIYGDNAAPLTADDIIPYLHTRNEISQVMRVYDKFCEWVQANYKYFDESDIGFSQQKYGKLQSRGGEEYIDIYPHRLDEFMKQIVQNMPTTQFVEGLRDRQILKTDNKGRLQFTARINDKVQRVYSIRLICNTSNVLQECVTKKTETVFMENVEFPDCPF